MRPRAAAVISLMIAVSVLGQNGEPVDTAAIEKIKAEAQRQSQAIEIARNLTDVYGPRLTNSPSARTAVEYVRKKLVGWKLDDVRLEPWNFGNGWTNDKFSVKLVSDPSLQLLAYPKAWTAGTNGPVSAEVVEAIIRTEADFDRLRGKLRGKFVMILPAPALPSSSAVAAGPKRFTDEQLAAMTNAPEQLPQRPASAAPPAAAAAPAPPAEEAGFFSWVENALSAAPAQPAGPIKSPARPANAQSITRERVTQFYFEEGVAAMIEPAPVRDGAILTVTATGETNAWKKDAKSSKAPPQIVIAADQYGKILERIQNQAPVNLEITIANTYLTMDTTSSNVVADIKGTDKADEFVVLGAHLDSMHTGKGATDNAAGVAVVMEAARILRALGLPMRRTVRLGLWTGEEQGLLGSRAFVDKYLLNRPIMQTRAAHAKLSAYFNVDNGTGAIRGVYMQDNAAIVPIFQAWMAPLKSLGVTTLAARSVGGTDHLSFDSVGLPGFQFIQDPIEYDSRTHHTNLDTFDKLLPEDLMKNAAIVASFVFLTANRDELLPRKPLPRSVHPAGSPVP
jgi:hypothetical protein